MSQMLPEGTLLTPMSQVQGPTLLIGNKSHLCLIGKLPHWKTSWVRYSSTLIGLHRPAKVFNITMLLSHQKHRKKKRQRPLINLCVGYSNGYNSASVKTLDLYRNCAGELDCWAWRWWCWCCGRGGFRGRKGVWRPGRMKTRWPLHTGEVHPEVTHSLLAHCLIDRESIW